MTEDLKPPAAEPDWEAIRARYEAGREKVQVIAAEIGLAGITLSRKAKQLGWAMRGKAKPLAAPAAGPASEAAEPAPASDDPPAAVPKAKRAKDESTTATLRRLKELLHKRIHHLEQALSAIGAEVKDQNNERDIRATNTLVRTLEKVLDLEHRERKNRAKRARETIRLNDAERDELARRIDGLCAEGPSQTAQPDAHDQRSAQAAVGVADLGAGGPASAAG